MEKRNFAVYRPTDQSQPVAVDISDVSNARAVDKIVQGRNWYGTAAESPEAAIEAFRRHEVIKALKSGPGPAQAAP